MSRIVLLVLFWWVPFSALAQFNPGLLPVEVEGKWGYINTNGEMVVEPIYDHATQFTSLAGTGVARVVRDNKSLIINLKGDEFVDPGLKDISLFNDSIYLYTQDRFTGLINFRTGERTEAVYLSAETMNNIIRVSTSEGYGALNHKLTEIIPCKYDYIGEYEDGYIFSDSSRLGFLDNKCVVKVPPRFYYIQPINHDLFWVSDSINQGLWSYSRHRIIFSCNQKPEPLTDRYAILHGDTGQIGLLNLEDFSVIRSPFDRLDTFGSSNDVLMVFKDESAGLWDPVKGVLVEPKFSSIKPLNNIYIAGVNGRFVLVNKAGQVMTDTSYDNFRTCDVGYFAFRNSKTGLVSYSGKELIPPVYNRIWWNGNIFKCSMGSTVVMYEIRDGSVWDRMVVKGLIRSRSTYGSGGMTISAPDNKRIARWFRDDNQLWGLLDENGDTAISPRYNDVESIQGTPYAIAEKIYPPSRSRTSLYKGYAVVDESMSRPLCAPIFVYVDHKTLVDEDIHVIRVRDAQGMFRMIKKQNGLLLKYRFEYQDTFTEGRSKILLYGNLNKGGRTSPYVRNQYVGNYAEVTTGWGVIPKGSEYVKNRYQSWYAKNATWTFINEQGNLIPTVSRNSQNNVNSNVEAAGVFRSGTVPILVRGLWYLLDRDGFFDDTTDYYSMKYLPQMKGTYYQVKSRNSRYGLADRNGNLIGNIEYTDINLMHEGVAWARKGSQWGLLDSLGNWKTMDEPVIKVCDFNGGIGAVMIRRRWYFVDKDLNKLYGDDQRITRTKGFSDGVAYIRFQNEKGVFGYAYINDDFEVLTKPKFVKAYRFSNGLGRVITRGRYRFVNRAGEIVGGRYKDAGDFDGKFAKVKKRGLWGLIDINGKMVIPANFEYITISETTIHAFKNEMVVVFDLEGNHINTVKDVSAMYGFSDGLNRIRKGILRGYLNPDGSVAVECKYSYATSFENGLALVGDRETRITINRNGDTISQKHLSTRNGFSDGLILTALCTDGKTRYQYYDKNLNLAIGTTFDRALDFKNGLAYVEIDNQKAVINTTGKIIIPPGFGQLEQWNDRSVKIRSESLQGVIDHNGKQVVPVAFDRIEYVPGAQMLFVSNGELNGYMNMQGEWIWRSDHYKRFSRQ